MRKGANHFSRLNYHVKRGMKDLITDHSLTVKEWEGLMLEFDSKCAFCEEIGSLNNRGIVPDHLIAAAENGEYVIGNIVLACQTCNDRRGSKNWDDFLKKNSGSKYGKRCSKIIDHIDKYKYIVSDPLSRLNLIQSAEYKRILSDWNNLWESAILLRDNLKIEEKNR